MHPVASSTSIVYTPALSEVIMKSPSALRIIEPETGPVHCTLYGGIPPEIVTCPSPSFAPGADSSVIA